MAACSKKTVVRSFIKLFKTAFLWIGILYVYVTTFGLILPWLCQDLGYSSYYNPSLQSKEKIDLMNNMRTSIAYKTLANMPKNLKSIQDMARDDSLKHNGNSMKITFVVVSVSRPANPHYLVQVVSRLLYQTLEKKMAMNSKIIVFNADNKPSQHEDIKFISNFVTVVSKEDLNHQNDTSDLHIYEKEKQDYVLALQLGIRENAEYTVIIEDDALPDGNFLRNLSFLIKWKIPWLRSSPKWAFIKLYYPEKWQGFGNTEIPELVILFLISGTLSGILYLSFRKNPSHITLFFIFITSGGYFTCMAYTIGRAHLIELGKISAIFFRITKAQGCCTPAVLYPKEHISNLVLFLQKKTCSTQYPFDFALDDFVTSEKLVKYLVSPNMFTHIGFHSSLNKADKDIREFSLLFDP